MLALACGGRLLMERALTFLLAVAARLARAAAGLLAAPWRRRDGTEGEAGAAERTRTPALAGTVLERSRERLVLALEATTDGIWDWDLRTGALVLSPRWHTMLGYAPDELGEGAAAWLAAVHPEDRAAAEAALDTRRATTDATFATEYRVLARSGEVR
jgi:PAS domain S-box-containing protein